MGMPHRGRLNVLTNVVRKPFEVIFAEFQGKKVVDHTNEEWGNSGDVKYHLGTSYQRTYPNGRSVKLTLLPNPSHLEAVDPVLQGRVRCEQHYLDDQKRDKVAGIAIHGDAAFAGQGIVYETI